MSDIITGERDLGRAVILRAVEDADMTKDSIDRREARLFLCAKNKLWENSLRCWCFMAGWEFDDIVKYARGKWMEN